MKRKSWKGVLSCLLALAVASAAAAQQASGESQHPNSPAQTPAAQRERIIYRLKYAPSIDIANAVSELLRKETPAACRGEPAQPQAAAVTIIPEPVSNSLMISAPPGQLEAVTRLIEQLDRCPRTVAVRLLIAEVEIPEPKGAEGVKADLGSTLLQTLGQSSLTDVLDGDESGATPKQGGEKKEGGKQLDRLLQALEKRGRVKIIAHPHIMTLDNQPALLRIGKQVPLETGGEGENGDPATVAALTNVGLSVAVTPRVSGDDAILMELDVELSERKPSDEHASHADLTTLQTTVQAKDGQAVVLGGMIAASEQGRRELLVLAEPSIIQPGDENP